MIDAENPSFAPPLDVQDEAALAYWADRLQTTTTELLDVVAEVGANPKAVATELGVALLD